MSLIDLLEPLFEQTDEVITLLMDLDGTLLPIDDRERKRQPLADSRIVSAGDSRIDLSIIRPGENAGFRVLLGIMVNNAHRDLVDSLAQSGDSEQLYRATRQSLEGVIEGLVEAMKRLLPPDK